MVQCVLFDFFGTLVNYTHGRTDQDFSTTHTLLRDFNVGIPLADMVKRFDQIFIELESVSRMSEREFSMFDAVRMFLAGIGQDDNPELELALVDAYLADWSQHVELLAGIDTYLRRLAKRYRLGIITNTHHAPMIHDLLAQMNASQHFEEVVTSVEHGRPKPHPAMFEHALRQMQLEPKEVVYVGDSFDADYKGATGAAIGCYLIGKHARVPVERQIPSVFDLPARLFPLSGHR